MNATQSGDKTSTKTSTNGESIKARFWERMADLILDTEHESQGCHEIEVSQRTYAVADAYVDQASALVLPFPLPQIPSEDLTNLAETQDGDAIGVRVGPWKFSAVANPEYDDGDIFTLRLSEPELIETVTDWEMEGPVTETDLEYLGA